MDDDEMWTAYDQLRMQRINFELEFEELRQKNISCKISQPMKALSLENSKQIHQSSNDLVFGYINDAQKMFPNNNSYYNISILFQWILLYYHQREYLNTNYPIHDSIEISKAFNIATVVNHKYGSMVRGVIVIDKPDNFMYIWKIKIIKLCCNNTYQWLAIGLADKNLSFRKMFLPTIKDQYFYKNDGQKSSVIARRTLTYGEKTKIGHFDYGTAFHANDVIKMIYNGKENTLEFWKNNISQGIAFKNIRYVGNAEYTMVIIMPFQNNCVELIDFNQISINQSV